MGGEKEPFLWSARTQPHRQDESGPAGSVHDSSVSLGAAWEAGSGVQKSRVQALVLPLTGR